MLASWLLHSHGAFSHFSFSENHDHARDSWHDCCHGCRDRVSTYTCLQEKILNPETLRGSPFVLLLMLPLIVSRSPPSGAPPQGSRRSRRCRVPRPFVFSQLQGGLLQLGRAPHSDATTASNDHSKNDSNTATSLQCHPNVGCTAGP